METFFKDIRLLCANYLYKLKDENTDWHCRTINFNVDGYEFDFYKDPEIQKALTSNNIEKFYGMEIYCNGIVKQLNLIDGPKQRITNNIKVIFPPQFMGCLTHIIRDSMNHNIPWETPDVDFNDILNNNYHE